MQKTHVDLYYIHSSRLGKKLCSLNYFLFNFFIRHSFIKKFGIFMMLTYS